MKSRLNKERRKKARRARDIERRRARHLGLEEIPPDRRLKFDGAYNLHHDHRPNRTIGHENR